MKTKLMVAALLASVGTLATAANDRPYYGLQGSVIFPDHLRNNEDGYGANILFGLPVTQHLAVELNMFGLRMEKKTNGSEKEVGAGLDLAFYPFTRARVFAPFLLIGSGAQYEDRSGPSRGYTFHDAGLGFLVSFTSDQTVSLRVDAKRYRINDNELIPGRDQLWDTRLNAGVQVSFGGGAAAAAETPAAAAPAAQLDSDGDGVADALDRCPNSPRGSVVDSTGCPPDTKAAAGNERLFNDVLFDFDRSEITAAGQLILDNAAEVVNSGAYKNLRVNVAGHTDEIGSEGYNQALSERRANTVRSYLVKKGVDASRIHTFAYGESAPKASNGTDAGRAQNRRAEIKTGE